MREPKELIAQLLLEYSKKISDCEKLLIDSRIKNAAKRRAGATHEERVQMLHERQILNAQRQAYIQAHVDIESVLDSIEFSETNEVQQ